MILPVPSNGRDPVRLFKVERGAWSTLESFFPNRRNDFEALSFGSAGGFGASEKVPLPVERIGGYTCTIVPSIQDFARVSTFHFTVPVNIQRILQENYGTGFAFIVCIFDTKVAAHPIGIVSSALPDGRLFIPTRHAHGDENNVADELVSHIGIGCDGCEKTPIIGNRWKCVKCNNYDLCNGCYQNRSVLHPHKNHFFLHLTQEVKTLQDYVKLFPDSRGRFDSESDSFDHTIYLVNSVLLAGPADYSEISTSDLIRQTVEIEEIQQPKHVMRVKINGNHFQNMDYYAFRV